MARLANREYRDSQLYKEWQAGKSITDLAVSYFLSESFVKTIIKNRQSREVIAEQKEAGTSEVPKQYSVIYSQTLQGISANVNIALKDGWIPQGGICRAPEWDYTAQKQIWYYSQAVIKL